MLPYLLQQLAKLLPQPPPQPEPTEDAEEVDLVDYEARHNTHGHDHRQAYHSDDDDEEGGGPSVQCAHQ